MADLPQLGTTWQPRDNETMRLITRPGVVVGICDQPSVILRHPDGSQTQTALSAFHRDLEPAPDLSGIPSELLQLELDRRHG